jgi:hypothetical protein
MFDHETLAALRKAVRERTEADRRLLDQLRDEVRPLASSVRTIKPRGTTSVSLVASDGGNNKLVFDPFTVQLVRVVDSYGKELFFDVISPTTDTDILSAAQFNADGSPKTPLGRMMKDLGDLKTLSALSHMIHDGKKTREEPHKISPSWVLSYRDLCEWAVLYDRICYHTFASDTLIVRDGLLRSKLFRGELFVELRKKIEAAIMRIREKDRRWVFLVGIAKHSTVLTRYHLALTIEKVMPPGDARYVKVPREVEAKAYVWPEWARGAESEGEGEAPKNVAGDMYLVRFGKAKGDPIWAVDIFSCQKAKDAEIFGYLLADAIDGFPVPFYPRCLQKAHEFAQVVDFDLTILQDVVFKAVRGLVPDGAVIDEFMLNVDASARRYE